MTIPILTTKLYIPTPPHQPVLRPRLLKKLEYSTHRKLTLASAPAGFGKTTLISGWLSADPRPVAWLSLDERDSDPVRFLRYVVAALQAVSPDIGNEVATLLDSPQPPPIDALLTPLLNQLASVPDAFVLVLDDYHILDAHEIDTALTFLIENQPPLMHLVLTTREDPRLPLARLRARGQMTEIRIEDLRFTMDEAADFLNHTMTLDLLPDDIETLERRTEGWIAGLQLAALSLQGRDNVRDFVDAFAGDHRYIVDYLADEVLRRQPENIRNFLLQTSILDQLSVPLCAAVTREENRDLLDTLERGNLFIIPLDDDRRWYRYHHLFADVLHAHLMKESPDLIPHLHQRASEWYEQNGWQPDAIRHALLAQDYERAAALVEMAWPALFNGYRPMTWFGWVEALPDNLVRNRPVLNLGAAWTLLHEADLDRAEVHLNNAARWQADEMVVVNRGALDSLPFLVDNARLYLMQARRSLPTVIELMNAFLESTPENVYYNRGLTRLFGGLAYWTNGDLETAYQFVADSVADLKLSGYTYFAVIGTSILAEINAVQGPLREAATRYEQALQLPMVPPDFALRNTVDRYIGMSEIYREWNDIETALTYMQHGKREMMEQAIFPGRESRWYAAMARIRLAEGDLDEALTLLDNAQRLYKRDVLPDLRPITAEKARICILLGKLTEAAIWAQEHGLSPDDEPTYRREFEHITLARLLIAQGAHKDALQLLNRLLIAAEDGGRGSSVIAIYVQQAMAYAAQGNVASALVPLQHALTTAAPEGYIRVFVDEGLPMKLLLAEARTQNIVPDYVDTLLAAFIDGTATQTHRIPPDEQPLIEPLSERELEVLHLVADGLSNREISERLFIALSTVKGHNRVIYEKLGVSRRTEAVARARELGLI